MLRSPNRISRFAFLLVFLVMAATSLIRNEVFRGTTNVITWDGYGYYAYLPGAFIYGDIEHYAFAEQHFEDYDISSSIYQLNPTEDGGRFPIYNIGLSVIWTPAFLVTHGIVSATGIAPADGMSYPYQLMVVLMGLLFAFLGLLYLKRFLALFFSDLVVGITLLAVGLGTNIFYYIVEKPDMTHGYLFALYSVFLYYFSKLVMTKSSIGVTSATSTSPPLSAYPLPATHYLLLGLLIGLMCLVRSSEIVVFAIPAFYGLKNWDTFKRNFERTLPIFLAALAVFSIQLIYYKVGTGSWWQDGYAGLSFDWLEPHLLDGLFSYRRGWLVYTPIMTLAFVGIFRLPKAWILPVVIFLIGNLYILFSWHIWWYGNTFGSRPVTQSYALLALPLAAFVAWVLGENAGAERGNVALSPSPSLRERGDVEGGTGHTGRFTSKRSLHLRSLAPLLLLPFIFLNLFQHWQYNQRIIPLDFTNRTYYWEVFGKTSLDKKDRVYLDTDEKMPVGEYVTTELLTTDTLVSVAPKSSREFTNLLEHKVTATEAAGTIWLGTSLAFSYYGDSYDKWKFPSVVTEHRRGAETLKWVQVRIPPTMDTPEDDYLRFNLSLPGLQEGDVVKQYLWNLCQDSMVVRNYDAELLTAGRGSK
ncbi:hypothetical protein FUA23_06485 [Neolewinella aurantiaca]|uniref:Glycosyltransferase RgtA/B/C/D-like domain-containing protein n=1 Tax=Neolewinella aurantiaca TaxID=2602767 RepID=A0A5C7FXZ3_9BACT|nr:hypothetical protein [Neolewinella aurantiaca]TXF90432.1 hypothetical protein FUA23_06485 [Neolewinella aurantiaca]